jgi:hypothetical protein
MPRTRIRHLASSYDGTVIAAGEWVKSVQTWSIDTRERVAEFDTVLEPGGQRLAISRDGKLCAAGAYDGGSLAKNRYLGGSAAVYDALTGEMLWQNKGIKRVQELKFSMHQPGILFASFSDQPLHVVDSRTGAILKKLRGVRSIIESPFEKIQFRESAEGYFLVDSENDRQVGRLSRANYGPLDVTFSDIYAVVSEVGGRMRCFDMANRAQVWEHHSEKGYHVVAMKYNEKTRDIVGIDLDYEKGKMGSIVWLDENTGLPKRRLPFDARWNEVAFALKGTTIVTSNGGLMDASDGKEIARLDFPREMNDASPSQGGRDVWSSPRKRP